MIAAFGGEVVSSWGVSMIRRLGVMTISAPEPDPERTERESDAVAGGTDRSVPAPGGLRLVGAAGCDDPGGVRAGRRLRTGAAGAAGVGLGPGGRWAGGGVGVVARTGEESRCWCCWRG